MVIALVVSESRSGGSFPTQRQVGLTDPIGLLLGTAVLGAVALVGSLVLYTLWSFTEYRRLRDRIPDPRPPSPFRHPTRLVTILIGNYELDEYGRRVQRTGFALVVLLFLAGVSARLFVG
jgi:hypothetical protein